MASVQAQPQPCGAHLQNAAVVIQVRERGREKEERGRWKKGRENERAKKEGEKNVTNR